MMMSPVSPRPTASSSDVKFGVCPLCVTAGAAAIAGGAALIAKLKNKKAQAAGEQKPAQDTFEKQQAPDEQAQPPATQQPDSKAPPQDGSSKTQ